MQRKKLSFSQAAVAFYFDAGFSLLRQKLSQSNAVLITDENVFNAHEKKFRGWNVIVLKPGEAYKVQPTVDAIIDQLIEMGADRSTTLVGVGGGVVTDLTGYVASVYMRGISFGFVPTTILAMVDAAIGGKNGIDVGLYKNMVGTIRQPDFLIYDTAFLSSLPEAEWQNGFAEIIKHAAIKNASMFEELGQRSLSIYRKNKKALSALIQANALLKARLVQRDEFENGERKLLNFGHTLGHAIENLYELSHGQAISIGMVQAAALSEKLLGFQQRQSLIEVLQRYGLPTAAEYNRKKVFSVLRKDKKKAGDRISFILLKKIGRATIHPLSFTELEELLA